MEGVEYLYDEHGKVKGVIIPPELWEKIKAEFFEPSKYRGIYRGKKNLEKGLRELRGEWERDFYVSCSSSFIKTILLGLGLFPMAQKLRATQS